MHLGSYRSKIPGLYASTRFKRKQYECQHNI